MAPNILSINPLLTLTFSGFLKIFNPQKVKNIVTFFPIAAAPLAIIKEAIALSKSPLNTTMVLLSFSDISLIPTETLFTFLQPFFITAIIKPLSFLISKSSLLVLLHQAFTSGKNPGSEAFTFSISPSSIYPIVEFTCINGPGQLNPHISNSLSILSTFFMSLLLETCEFISSLEQ